MFALVATLPAVLTVAEVMVRMNGNELWKEMKRKKFRKNLVDGLVWQNMWLCPNREGGNRYENGRRSTAMAE